MRQKYEACWDSLDKRGVPEWFRKAKLGIFIHWGIYSVPAYAPKRKEVDTSGGAYSEWYGWQVPHKNELYYRFHKNTYGESFGYKDFVSQWKAELFDPVEWAKLFKFSGAKYVITTSKHHDAFCLWPSYYSMNWNSVDVGPKRNLLKEIDDAVRAEGLISGLYYSLLEWDHPVMFPDAEKADISRLAKEKLIPQMKELIEEFKPKILYTDGEWSYHSSLWHSEEFLQWLFNESSVRDEIVINDRWGSDTRAQHGGYISSEYGEVNSPTISEENAKKRMNVAVWEELRSIGASFGYNRNERLSDYLSEKEMIYLLVDTVCKGGNLCLNVGPNADGTISPLVEERLRQLGEWMHVNGEAVYESEKANVNLLPEGVGATKVGETIYLFFKKYPKGKVCLKDVAFKNKKEAVLLGKHEKLPLKQENDYKYFEPTPYSLDDILSRNVYVFKIN